MGFLVPLVPPLAYRSSKVSRPDEIPHDVSVTCVHEQSAKMRQGFAGRNKDQKLERHVTYGAAADRHNDRCCHCLAMRPNLACNGE
jgi:hypothetical protein